MFYQIKWLTPGPLKIDHKGTIAARKFHLRLLMPLNPGTDLDDMMYLLNTVYGDGPEVSTNLGKRKFANQWEYLVVWNGMGIAKATWATE